MESFITTHKGTTRREFLRSGGALVVSFALPAGAVEAQSAAAVGATWPATIDPGALAAEMEAKLPGLAAHMEPKHPGMHTTDTIDFEYIVSGEVWLELDEGVTAHLKAGDTVVQNGTRHAWRNKSTDPCVIVVFMVGVPRNPSGIEVARGSV